jgi:hypothetical protein
MISDRAIARLEHLKNVEAAILNLIEVADAGIVEPTDSAAYGAVFALQGAAIAAEVPVRNARRYAESFAAATEGDRAAS